MYFIFLLFFVALCFQNKFLWLSLKAKIIKNYYEFCASQSVTTIHKWLIGNEANMQNHIGTIITYQCKIKVHGKNQDLIPHTLPHAFLVRFRLIFLLKVPPINQKIRLCPLLFRDCKTNCFMQPFSPRVLFYNYFIQLFPTFSNFFQLNLN